MFQRKTEIETIVISPLNSPLKTHFKEALFDISSSLVLIHTWLVPALRDIKLQYRRTYLGPWWHTLSSMLTILTLAALRHAVNPAIAFKETLNYVGIGWMLFTFLISPIVDASSVFLVPSSSVSHITPISSSALRAVARGFIHFGHEIVGLGLIFAITSSFRVSTFSFLLVLPLLLVANFGLILWLGSLTCRFRDIVPIISLVVKVQMFLSPIFWSLNDIDQESVLAKLSSLNPLTYLVVLMRDTILGTSEHGRLPIDSYFVLCVYAGLNIFMGFLTFGIARKKLVYWTETL